MKNSLTFPPKRYLKIYAPSMLFPLFWSFFSWLLKCMPFPLLPFKHNYQQLKWKMGSKLLGIIFVFVLQLLGYDKDIILRVVGLNMLKEKYAMNSVIFWRCRVYVYIVELLQKSRNNCTLSIYQHNSIPPLASLGSPWTQRFCVCWPQNKHRLDTQHWLCPLHCPIHTRVIF